MWVDNLRNSGKRKKAAQMLGLTHPSRLGLQQLAALEQTAVSAAHAQQYTVRKDAKGHTIQLINDSTLLPGSAERSQPLFRAGTYLKASASFDMMSWGFTILSAITYSGAVSDKRSTCNTLGTIMALGAVASRIASITFKSKAGTELQVSAGRVVLKF